MKRRNIVLLGMMGSGKTTVAPLLAKLLGMQWSDLDRVIEQAAGMSIAEIFERRGESGFRALESEICAQAGAKENTVISCGGGTVLRAENARALKENGIMVLLDVKPETVLERLKSDSTRPLLKDGDKRARLEKLYAERMPEYLAVCDLSVDASPSPEEVAGRILRGINAYNEPI